MVNLLLSVVSNVFLHIAYLVVFFIFVEMSFISPATFALSDNGTSFVSFIIGDTQPNSKFYIRYCFVDSSYAHNTVFEKGIPIGGLPLFHPEYFILANDGYISRQQLLLI